MKKKVFGLIALALALNVSSAFALGGRGAYARGQQLAESGQSIGGCQVTTVAQLMGEISSQELSFEDARAARLSIAMSSPEHQQAMMRSLTDACENGYQSVVSN